MGEKNLRPWRGDDHAKLEAEANNQNYADAERLQRAIRLTDAAIMQRLNGARTEEDLLLFDGIVHNSPLRRPRKGEAAAVGEAGTILEEGRERQRGEAGGRSPPCRSSKISCNSP